MGGDDIIRRRMEAEAEANDVMSAKDIKHSAPRNNSAQDNSIDADIESGRAIREKLLKRARARELDVGLQYNNSKLSSGMYRYEVFNSMSRDGRREMLGAQNRDAGDEGGRNFVREKRERLMMQEKKLKPIGGDDPNGGVDTSNNGANSDIASEPQKPGGAFRQSGGFTRGGAKSSIPRHTFRESPARNYNPYA